jgi:hypothetical protein
VNKFTIVASRIPDTIVAFGQTRHNIIVALYDFLFNYWVGVEPNQLLLQPLICLLYKFSMICGDEEWCLLGCYAVKTSNLTYVVMIVE